MRTIACCISAVAGCLRTPFGLPVVPDVYIMLVRLGFGGAVQVA